MDLFVLMVPLTLILSNIMIIIILRPQRGLLAPHEISNLDVRAAQLKVENFKHQKEQEKFLMTPMGKGILMLSLSLIKYRSDTK